MKKLLTLFLLGGMTFPLMAQGDLLVGKTVSVLGEPLTWTNPNGDYKFDPANSDHDLSKLTKDPRNTSNVFLFPEGQNGGQFTTGDYSQSNKEVGLQGFYVDMESTYTVESVFTTWEGAFATGYDIYLCAELPTKENLGTPAYTGTGLSGTEQTVNLENNNTGRYLVFQATDATNWGWGCKIRSISAYGDTKSVKGLLISEGSVVKGNNTTVTVTPVNILGEPLPSNSVSNYTLQCNMPDALTISDNGEDNGIFNIEGVAQGSYILTAKAIFNGEEVEGNGEFNVTYNWDSEVNVAANKKVYYRWKENGETTENTGDKVTDLNNETYYQYNGDWGGGNSWIVIDLGEENDFVIDAVEVYFPDHNNNAYVSNNTFKLSFGTSDAELPTEDKVWNPGEKWITTSKLIKKSGAIVTYNVLPEERIKIRYVAYIDDNNPNGKPMIGEIYVAGKEVEDAAQVESISISTNVNYISTDEKVKITALVQDQYGAVMEDQPVSIFVNNNLIDGFEFTPEAIGNYSIVGKCGDVSSEIFTLYVVAKAENKINRDSSEVSISVAVKKGEAGISTNPFTQETQWLTSEFGTPLIIEFDTPIELELLKFNWEAACPADYTVSVKRQGTRALENEGEIIMNVSGRDFIGGVNPVDRLYHDTSADGSVNMNGNLATCGADLSNIKTLIITPTAAKHNYNLRLLNIDAIGTQSFIDNGGMTTKVEFNIENASTSVVDVINLQGAVIKKGVKAENALENLPKGIYIVGGKKVLVK